MGWSLITGSRNAVSDDLILLSVTEEGKVRGEVRVCPFLSHVYLSRHQQKLGKLNESDNLFTITHNVSLWYQVRKGESEGRDEGLSFSLTCSHFSLHYQNCRKKSSILFHHEFVTMHGEWGVAVGIWVKSPIIRRFMTLLLRRRERKYTNQNENEDWVGGEEPSPLPHIYIRIIDNFYSYIYSHLY